MVRDILQNDDHAPLVGLSYGVDRMYFSEGAVKKVLASLEKCRHLLKELLKNVVKKGCKRVGILLRSY